MHICLTYVRIDNMECTFEGCTRQIKSKKLCSTHYYQQWEGRELTPIRVWRSDPAIICPVNGCVKSATVRGLCKPHASEAFRFNVSSAGLITLLKVEACESCGWKGNLHIDHDHSCCDYSGSCGSCIRGMVCRACNYAIGAAEKGNTNLREPQIYLKTRKKLDLGRWKT